MQKKGVNGGFLDKIEKKKNEGNEMEKHLKEIHEKVLSWIREIVPFVQKAVQNELKIDTKTSELMLKNEMFR